MIPYIGNPGIVGVNQSRLGVCVKPIHFMYNKTTQFIQFIELNRILGVNRYINLSFVQSINLSIYQSVVY